MTLPKLKITFDTNTIDKVARPHILKQPRPEHLKVYSALVAGTLKGYFSETLVTLEGIKNKDRISVLGSTRLERHSQPMGENAITISISVQQDRQPLNPKFLERVHAAQAIGMRALRGPSRIGWVRVQDEENTFYEPDDSVIELAACMDRVNVVATAIEARNVGRVAALSLGLSFSARAGAAGEWWFQGLLRAQNDDEQKRIQKAVREWADGDSVAAHVGYGIDLFCSEDWGRRAGGPSILDESNRVWLASAWSVKFVTIAELAAMI